MKPIFPLSPVRLACSPALVCLLTGLSFVGGQSAVNGQSLTDRAPLYRQGSFDQQGITADYYQGPAFTGREYKRRENKTDLLNDSCGSVRCTGYIVADYSERYMFTVAGAPADKVNDTTSVWVNDSLIIQRVRDSGDASGGESAKGYITLTAGIQYALRAEKNHGGVLRLSWQSKHQPAEVISGRSLIPEGAEMPPVRIMMNVIGRDPEVTLGPDSMYYMVHTSCYLDGMLAHAHCWDKNDGLHLWKSADLRNWTDLGLIWSIEKDGTWQREYDEKGRRPLWAPEIHFINKMKNWYVVYSMGTFAPLGIRTGLMKSLSGKPEGPYQDVVAGPITEGIDGSLYEEEGNVYFLRNHCLMAKMNDDLTGFVEPFRPLKTRAGKDVGFEGSGMLKVAGRYYLYSAKSNEDMGQNTYDLNIAVADSIYGPYSDSWLALRHGGHSSLFTDREGTIRATLFGSDELSDVYITPSLVQLALETGGRILPVRGHARARVILPFQDLDTGRRGSSNSRTAIAGKGSARSPVGFQTIHAWKYRFNAPPDGWNCQNFNESSWRTGLGGFGKNGLTPWKTGDIWIRKTFNPGHLTPAELDNLVLYISHNADVEAYINGVEACRMSGFNKYSLKKIGDKAKRALRNGRSNVLAIHCQRGGDASFVDAGLVTWSAY